MEGLGKRAPIVSVRNRLWYRRFRCESGTASAADLLAAADEMDRLKK
jgi:hypothetical protein